VAQSLPHTRETLARDLRALGLGTGDVVLMHSSMRSVGFVAGSTQAVVQALLDVLGPDGTLAVPTHTPENTDPAEWQNPPVPEEWWPVIRDHTPGFDPARTRPSRWMGVLADSVRTWPGALRSDHPQVSFAAVGRYAAEITTGHRLDDALGEQSPLGAVYRLNGKVLMLGCGYDSNTSLHLAEYRQESPPRGVTGSALRAEDSTGVWTTWTDVVVDEDDFEPLGGDFEFTTGRVTIGRVGDGVARLMSQRELVDFATGWMAEHRT
jgi:aminoglycoside 3-N-acetyltransferase